jgi:hypothetical protein
MTKGFKQNKRANRSPDRQLSAEENLKVSRLMDRLGLTKKVLIERYLIPLLSAKTTIRIREKGTTRRVSVRDNGTRQRALDMAFKLSGAYAPTNLKLAEAIGDDEPIDIIDISSSREGIYVVEVPLRHKEES